jgi:hypothetical protein
MMTRSFLFLWPPDFCRDTSDVPRRMALQSHLIAAFLRAQSLQGHTGRSFLLPVMNKQHDFIPPARNQDSR